MMSPRPHRYWGALLLGVLAAIPTTTVGAAAPRAKQVPAYQAASHSGATAPRKARRARRGRRLPPGGVVFARNAIILDPSTSEVLYQKNAGTSTPCASLTKLMTMMVFLEQGPDLARVATVTQAELKGGGHTQLRRGEQVRLEDLLHMSLMCSDNVATRVLVRESSLAADDFLARMNRKSVELGLARTRFVEFTGLDERNVSTAADVALMLRAAAANETLRSISTMRGYDFQSVSATYRVRAHHISNTNRLLYGRYEIRGGKTGFISEAGYCLATWVRTGGRDMIAVVMGAPTNATRFADVVRLVQHATKLAIAPSTS